MRSSATVAVAKEGKYGSRKAHRVFFVPRGGRSARHYCLSASAALEAIGEVRVTGPDGMKRRTRPGIVRAGVTIRPTCREAAPDARIHVRTAPMLTSAKGAPCIVHHNYFALTPVDSPNCQASRFADDRCPKRILVGDKKASGVRSRPVVRVLLEATSQRLKKKERE